MPYSVCPRQNWNAKSESSHSVGARLFDPEQESRVSLARRNSGLAVQEWPRCASECPAPVHGHDGVVRVDVISVVLELTIVDYRAQLIHRYPDLGLVGRQQCADVCDARRGTRASIDDIRLLVESSTISASDRRWLPLVRDRRQP